MDEGVTTKVEPSFTAWERPTKGLLAGMTEGIAGEAPLICDAYAGVTSFRGVGILAGIGMDSPTFSAWVLSSIGTGLGGGMGASVGAPYEAAEAEAMASAMISASSKKPSTGVPIAAGTSPLVG